MQNPIIVKLGGSVITYKDSSPPRVNEKQVSRIVKELTDCAHPLIVILGGGAHGHQSAHRHGFGSINTSPRQLLDGIPDIRHNMTLLALSIEHELNQNGIPSVVLSPFSFVTLRNNSIAHFPIDIIKNTLESGIAVIIHGDVCFDEIKSASILSGDTIAVYLAEELKARAVYIGTDVDGVLDDDPKKSPNANHIPVINQSNKNKILNQVGPSSNTDVTGGMVKKINELIELSNKETEIVIFNLLVPGRLTKLLLKEPTVCTRIELS